MGGVTTSPTFITNSRGRQTTGLFRGSDIEAEPLQDSLSAKAHSTGERAQKNDRDAQLVRRYQRPVIGLCLTRGRGGASLRVSEEISEPAGRLVKLVFVRRWPPTFGAVVTSASAAGPPSPSVGRCR